MTKILVTGATGNIGRKTLQQLLKRKPAGDLIGLARDPGKAADLAAEGIEIRQGDYLDYTTLVRAFSGVEKVMLVSATAFTDRDTQHDNVIKAAREAGVRHIVFMPVIRKEDSDFILPQVTEQDVFAVERIKASGLDYTFVCHPPFLENIALYLGGDILENGLPAPAADFILAWVGGINAGEWDGASGDLEKLLGRKPVTAAQSLRADDAQRQA